jgi:hypothetical protein
MADLPLLSHLLAGGLCFLFFWGAILTVKGSTPHRQRGRLFFVSLLPVGLSVGAILILRSETFDPARMIQFVYLLLCLLTVGTVGWTAVRWKNDLARFRGLHFVVLGPAMLISGATVLAAGAVARQPLAMILSNIGLVYGAAMIRFAWVKGPVHPKWWLGWHLNSVLLLSSAVHGTLLAVIYRALIDADGFDFAQLFTQSGTLLLALALRIRIGWQRGVPMRFLSDAKAAAVPAT